ncbi:MAG: cell wall-binding repeat-containing protein, partial [Firmicutes bacterium]|nr:cell wall-binding repeat-containing protein [Bacillota bacterium]
MTLGVSIGPSSVTWAQGEAFTRIAGADRMTTAIAVADALYPDGPPTKTVVIASGEAANWVDSVTVAPLASALKAPILLSASPTSLGDAVAAYLTGEGIQRVYLVGADANPTLARSLPPGIAVTPLSGSDRYATAAEIAQTLQQVTGTSGFGSLFIVDGGDRGLAQALAVDPYAASHGSPVLLAIPGQSTLPASEQAWVTRSTSQTLYLVGTAQGQGLATTYGSDQVVRIGTATATPDAVASAAAQLFAPSGGYTQVAIANADTTNGVALPDGNVVSAHLVDAIPGGPWAAATGAPILYVDGSQIPATTSTVINSALVSPTAKLWVFGGPNSIPDATANALAAMIANRTNAQQGPTSPPSLAISGQSFGSGSPTDPAVVSGNNPVTLTISNLPSPSTGTSTALWVAVNGQPAPTFSVGGQPLPTVSGPVNGGQNGLTAPLPPSSTGSLTVQMVPPPGSTAVYWLGLTSNGAPQASPLVLTFISNNTLAVVPGGTASSPYVAPVSSAANQTAGLVPLTVVVPPQGGSPAAGIPVTVTLLIPTAQSRPSSGPYLSDTQGGAVTTPTALAYTVSATTNGQGEATTYVNSTDVTTSPVEILATASDGTGTLSGSAYVTWQVPQATPPSSTGSSSGTPLTVTVTAAPGLSPQSLTATFATNGTVVATQALPLTAYNPASGAITVTVPATLPAGT